MQHSRGVGIRSLRVRKLEQGDQHPYCSEQGKSLFQCFNTSLAYPYNLWTLGRAFVGDVWQFTS